MNNEQFVSELSKLRPSSTFLTLRGYRSESSEIADYSIVFHMSYKSALERSIRSVQAMSLSNDLERQARTELLESFNKSLSKDAEEAIESRSDAFVHFTDDDGETIKGVKMHAETGTLYLYGLVVHKNVKVPGNYPVKNKRPLTIAKDKLRSLTSVGKFRMFKIEPNQVDEIVVENLSLLPPDLS